MEHAPYVQVSPRRPPQFLAPDRPLPAFPRRAPPRTPWTWEFTLLEPEQ